MQAPTRHRHRDLESTDYKQFRSFLNSAESWTTDRIQAWQLDKLNEIIAHAYATTPGYRKLMGIKTSPGELRSLAEVCELPTTNKEMLRKHIQDFTVADAKGEFVTTGGSTGIPLGFYRSKKAFAVELAAKAHQYARRGWHENLRQFVMRGVPITSSDGMQFFPEFNELRASSYHLTNDYMENYWQHWRSYQPEVFRCYPSSGVRFARYLQEQGHNVSGLKVILCASENLYDHQKQLLEEVFNCPVYGHYGQYEQVALAGYCERADTYHVLPFYSFVELIDTQGNAITQPGQVGEVVGTSFHMTDTPFIRYRTQDRAVFKSDHCDACGRPYMTWSRIDGRLQELVVTKTGAHVSMTAINMHDETFETIKQFQFEQHEVGKIILKYVADQALSDTALGKLKINLEKKFTDDMHLSIQRVESIPLTKRGKHRFLIQHLSLPTD